MSKESIKRKIAALRAKTVTSGCTEAEAIAAAAMAARLMQEHGVSEVEIEFMTARARAPKSMPRWQRWLADAICKATNTHAISCLGDIREIEFAGKEHAVEIALYLRDVLTRAVNAEIRTLREATPYRRLRKASAKSEMVNSFAAGMVSRLSRKLIDLFASTINADERAVAKQMLAEKYQDARAIPARKVTLTNGSAYFAGQRVGDAVQLSHGVSTRGGPLMIGSGS
jgi:hypothetical protein